MLEDCRWLALEAKHPDQIASFYETHLHTPVVSSSDREVVLDVGGASQLRIRRPDGVPRGGLHTHYALSCPADSYNQWWEKLGGKFDLEEVDFGNMRSLYFYDPVGNCVEIAGTDEARGLDEPTVSGIFEVVFEVESLPDAESLYTDLGFEIVDRGDNRRRSRLTAGAFDIELWEPHLGLADARGGVHVDIGITSDDPAAIADAVDDRVTKRESIPNGVRIRDDDGHYLTLLEKSTIGE